MQGFLLIDCKFKYVCGNQDQQRNQESPPESRKDDDDPPEICTWIEIAISNCSHSDDNTPYRLEEAVKVKLTECIPIWKFEDSQQVSEHNDWSESDRRN